MSDNNNQQNHYLKSSITSAHAAYSYYEGQNNKEHVSSEKSNKRLKPKIFRQPILLRDGRKVQRSNRDYTTNRLAKQKLRTQIFSLNSTVMNCCTCNEHANPCHNVHTTTESNKHGLKAKIPRKRSDNHTHAYTAAKKITIIALPLLIGSCVHVTLIVISWPWSMQIQRHFIFAFTATLSMLLQLQLPIPPGMQAPASDLLCWASMLCHGFACLSDVGCLQNRFLQVVQVPWPLLPVEVWLLRYLKQLSQHLLGVPVRNSWSRWMLRCRGYNVCALPWFLMMSKLHTWAVYPHCNATFVESMILESQRALHSLHFTA